MKNFLRGLIIVLIINFFVTVIPIKLFTDINNYNQSFGTLSQGDDVTYLGKLSKLINSNELSVDNKKDVIEMFKISIDATNTLKRNSYMLIAYLVILLTLVILIGGIIRLKRVEKSKYISKALITSGIISTLVILIEMFKIFSNVIY